MRKRSFPSLVSEVSGLIRTFHADTAQQVEDLLAVLALTNLGRPADVVQYHDVLLYAVAYPQTEQIHRAAELELKRIALHVEQFSVVDPDQFENSGIAGSLVTHAFSLTLNGILLERHQQRVLLYPEWLNTSEITAVLGQELDAVEYEMLSASVDWESWSTSTTGSYGDMFRLLQWIVNTSKGRPGSTMNRELDFSRFNIYTSWQTSSADALLTCGRAPSKETFIHSDGLIRTVSLPKVLRGEAPRVIELSLKGRRELIEISQSVLAGKLRETDPSTHARAAEVTYLDMGRGLTIALYPMHGDMKMALQSYIGYMAFKNGVPCAYGGGWLLFKESGFGVNILEQFRGGESALIVGQLLRAYHHVFGVHSFTIDPYQIGYDNEDGIATGAFWFYYRLGFRPAESRYRRLASAEWKNVQNKKGYRSSVAVLRQLANSSMRWTRPGSHVQPIVADRVATVVTNFVNEFYAGSRSDALKAVLLKLSKRLGKRINVQHPIGRIAILMAASGYLEKAPKKEVERFVVDYSLKRRNETVYVRQSQTHPLFIELVRRAERSTPS